jgi:tetratricopeptide (TPR) repeat protein
LGLLSLSLVALGKQVEQYPRKRVIVMQGRDYSIDPTLLFWEESPPNVQDIGSLLSRFAVGYLSSQPDIALVVPGREAFLGKSKTSAAEEFLELSKNLFYSLRTDEALQALSKGISAGFQEFMDVTDPQKMADLFLYAGLAYQEKGQDGEAIRAFKKMFFVAPEYPFHRKEFRKGYFPEKAEELMKIALQDFLEWTTAVSPLQKDERIGDLLASLNADALIYIFATKGAEDKKRVEVRVYEARDKKVAQVFSARRLASMDNLEDTVQRLLSQYVACADLPSRKAVIKKHPAVYFDTGGAYTTYLSSVAYGEPTRSPFHSIGFSTQVSVQLAKEIDVFGGLNILTSIADKYNDLLSTFTTVRFRLGVGYTFQGKWGRFYVHLGIDGQYLSDFRYSTSADCKFFGEVPGYCDKVNRLPYNFQGGSSVAFGVDAFIHRPVFVGARAGAGAYFFPASFSQPLNYPVFAELFLGYAFF